MIEAYGKSFDEVKQRIKRGLGYQKLLETQWTDKINVTEEDAQKYYSENKREFETPEQVRASHILIKSDTTAPDSDPNQAKAKAKEKAEGLLKQIKEGADFAELAKVNSTCPSAAKGGDLDFFTRGRMVPPFEKAAFKLDIGQTSEVVETRFGYHIIKVTDKKQAATKTFEQAKDDIMNTLTQTKQGEFAKTYIESLKADASILYPPGKEPPADSVLIAPTKPRPTAPPDEKSGAE
ncbi:MAG: peptidylprolyl isomerase [Planctomycetota bacterium]|nr:MAG: peptidylprolyl isomerase [Planctomycetota bacterium]